MKIIKTSINHFSIPLTSTISIGTKKLEMREGYLLVITDENGNMGYGEVSILPGLDSLTLEECLAELKDFAGKVTGTNIILTEWNPRAPFLGLMDLQNNYSNNVLFGIESALLFLLLKQPDYPYTNYFGKIDMGLSIPVNGLFYPDETAENLDKQYDYLKQAGFETVKVKIGRMSEQAEISRIRELSERLNKRLILRLDGNRSLLPEELDRYYDALEEVKIEYSEDPFIKKSMFEQTSRNLALDESMPEYIISGITNLKKLPERVRALVIKTSWFKGIHGIIRTIDTANREGLTTVLSSSFNTGAGISALALISRFMDDGLKTPQGFDTYRYLDTDLLLDKLQISEGSINIPGSIYFFNNILNPGLLPEVHI